jgi:hypothetical protein
MLSIIKLKTMILIANGQIPAPNNSCAWTWSNPKVLGQKGAALTRNALVMNAKAVVMRAMKHPQNNFISGSES